MAGEFVDCSGAKQRMGRISKMGDRYLRRLLVSGMTSQLQAARRKPQAHPWVTRLLASKPNKPVAVAMAVRVREEVLTVSAALVFAGKWLVWRLTKFNSAHPDIRVRVDASEHIVDPDFSDVDVCIRVGNDKRSGANASKILDQRVFPVCSPAMRLSEVN